IDCQKIMKHWIEFQLVDEQGKPLTGISYKLKSRGNKSVVRTGTTDGNGLLREEDLPPMPVILSIPAQPLANEMVKRPPRQQTGEANSHVKSTAILDGHEYQYITLGMLSDGYPTINGWQEVELQNSEHFNGSTLQGLSTHQLKRRHVLEIRVIQGCACDRDITLGEFKKIAIYTKQKILKDNLEAFNQGFKEFDITTCREKSHFLAQILHETGGLRATKESGGENKSYNPWYGRGFIQLTYEDAYTRYGNYIGEDFTSSDQARDKLLSLPHSVLSAFWYYKKYKSCVDSAKNDDFNKVTAIINGGFTHYNDRLDYLKRAIKAFKAEHLNQLLNDEKFEFASSAIYNNRVNSFAWGLWHDPDKKVLKGTLKDKNEALKGYERAQELIIASPFGTQFKGKKIYGMNYSNVLSYINKRIINLKGNSND
ncbi:glycoside hydrolase family 19 protein, partial [Xenorhabdus koppenhoeferi]|uniref:glycoside hydrolase family 19 protein n=1 Tax=Xenorhabdus koppenhoeferi TaxID=351659 RepID=UPI0038CD80BA